MKKTVELIVFAVFLGFAINLILVCVQWKLHGYDSVIKSLDLRYKQQLNVVGGDLNLWSETLRQWLINLYNETSFMSNIKTNAGVRFTGSHDQLPLFVKNILLSFRQVFIVSVMTFKVVIAKSISVLGGMMVYLFSGLLGALDGLCARYIRTSEGGRESTYLFHKLSVILTQVPFFVLLLFLVSPINISPQVIVMMLSILCLAFSYASCSQLKKYV